MQAIVQDRYGSPAVLALGDIEEPVAKDDEVLVRVRAASVHPDVWHMVRGLPYVLRIMGAGLRRPKNPVPGTDMAGHVASIGEHVTRFQPGDAVFGETVASHQWMNGGAFAEYVAVPEDALALKPVNITFEQAAAVPTSALIALHGLRTEGNVQPGQKVLVNGAAGGVGSSAVQLAKAYGAHVTGVDVAGKLDLVRSLGADHVMDCVEEDFTRGSARYDLIVDVPGNHSFRAVKRALTPAGTYVLIGHDHYGAMGRRLLGGLPRALGLMALSPFSKQLPKNWFSLQPKKESMAILTQLIAAGQLTPVVDRAFPLGEVAEALRYLEQGRARGKIVITV